MPPLNRGLQIDIAALSRSRDRRFRSARGDRAARAARRAAQLRHQPHTKSRATFTEELRRLGFAIQETDVSAPPCNGRVPPRARFATQLPAAKGNVRTTTTGSSCRGATRGRRDRGGRRGSAHKGTMNLAFRLLREGRRAAGLHRNRYGRPPRGSSSSRRYIAGLEYATAHRPCAR